MPCKIQIKENLTNTIDAETKEGLSMSMEKAVQLANKINREFRTTVVSFPSKGERTISVPNSLIDTYYNFEKKLEVNDFAKEEVNVSYQVEEMPMTPASEGTIERVKMVAEKMGLSFDSLSNYLKGNPDIPDTGITALVDQFKNVIAIASGKEAEAITEETVHVATSILEQTNPEFITELISQIGKFKIYKKTLDAYKNKKAYQLSNGKPNIRKIKKEAVDKLIAEVIVQGDPDTQGNPELLQITMLEQIKNWWKNILNNLKGKYKATSLDMFETAASLIMNDGLGGDVNSIKDKDIYYQTASNSAVDNMFNYIKEKAKNLVLVDETKDKKRHYLYNGKEVKQSVTEMIKGNRVFSERSNLEKIGDESKRTWGLEGHEYIENYITENLIDSAGYALNKPTDKPIKSNLSSKEQVILKNFAKKLIASYPQGTRFIIEVKVVNESFPGMVASTIDFLALEPSKDKDGNDDVKIDILDWKFSSFDQSMSGGDIPFYKQKDWKAQMGEYTRMLTNYGATVKQIRKARMIPFKTTYKYKERGKPESGLSIKKIEVGSLTNLKDVKTYLLPVATDSESTGYNTVDNLLSALRAEYKKLYDTIVPEEEKPIKNIELNEISKAIRMIHIKHDFEPLLAVADTFIDRAVKLVDGLKNVDYSQMDTEEIRENLRQIKETKNSAEKYLNTVQAFRLVMDKNNKKDREIERRLSIIDTQVSAMLNMPNEKDANKTNRRKTLTELQSEYAVQEAINRGLVDPENADDVLRPEKKIDKLSRSFLEASKLPAKLIQLGVDMVLRVKSLTDLKYNEKMNEYRKLLIPLEKVATAKGKKAFDMIAKKTATGLKLIKKLDPNFINEVNDSKVKKDRAFFKKNMDPVKYKQMLDKTIKENTDRINSRTWYPLDAEANQRKKDFEIKKLKDRVDINRPTFNGFDTPHFSYLFYNSINEENHYSKEFKELKSVPEAFKMWEFYTDLNNEAKKMGYLGKNALSFFPLVEATTIERLVQSDNKFAESGELFQDLYKVKVNERQGLAKLNPETGLLDKTIPKYYTATDRQVEQLSTNLDMVGSLWIKSLLDYKASKNMEWELLTLLDVEKSKKNLSVNNGQLIFKGGEAITEDAANQNAAVFETYIDDAVYYIKEDLDSWGAKSVSAVSSVGAKGPEDAEQKAFNVKKGIKTTDVLFRSLAIGLKPLIGLANYFGLNFQALINAGEFYNYREFLNNHAKILGNQMGLEKKALLHYIMPLNEDIVAEKRRETAREAGSLTKWLSTWTFTDVMMSTNAFPERLLQLTNANAMNQNSMVVDGKIVNIRQHLKAEDRKKKYGMSASERRTLEKTFEARVKELKETKSLVKIVKIEGDKISIPGATLEAVADYRVQIQEYGRKLSGLMSENNKMGYRRDTILSSFMMFKSWMPKHLGTRILGIDKNLQLNQWEYGKTRLFIKVASTLGFRNLTKMKDIISGNEEGVKIMRQILEDKKRSYFNETGKKLTITEEEFFDLVRTELENQMKELLVLVSVVGITMRVSAMEPPEDATDAEKNQYKYFAKLFNKTADEIQFYYSPLAFLDFTSGAILPSLGLVGKVWKAFMELKDEAHGRIIDDEEIMDGADPLKYFLNVVPGAAQFQTELLPLLFPEIARELRIKVVANPFNR